MSIPSSICGDRNLGVMIYGTTGFTGELIAEY